MASFQGVLSLVLGVGLLAVDGRARSTGWLPCGPRGLAGRLLVRKADHTSHRAPPGGRRR